MSETKNCRDTVPVLAIHQGWLILSPLHPIDFIMFHQGRWLAYLQDYSSSFSTCNENKDVSPRSLIINPHLSIDISIPQIQDIDIDIEVMFTNSAILSDAVNWATTSQRCLFSAKEQIHRIPQDCVFSPNGASHCASLRNKAALRTVSGWGEETVDPLWLEKKLNNSVKCGYSYL